jgi:hypothetical protein
MEWRQTALGGGKIAIILFCARRNRVRTGKPSCVSVWTDTTVIQDRAQGKCFVLGCGDQMGGREGLKLTPGNNWSPCRTAQPGAAAPPDRPAVRPSPDFERNERGGCKGSISATGTHTLMPSH